MIFIDFFKEFAKMIMSKQLGGENMANMKNAKKKVKTSAKEKELNRVFKGSMRTAIKNTEKAVTENNKEKALENLNIAIKRIDKAGSKGIVHSNFVARNKSRLTKKVNEMK